jgi:uncharacterized protein YukE
MNVGAPILQGDAIPGEPDGLRAVASRLETAEAEVTSVQRRVANNGLQGGWSGQAAEAFRSSLDRLPDALETVGGAFAAAAAAVTSFAAQLAGFQENASHYAAQIANLETDREGAQRRHDDAQTKVESARLARAAATDPVGLKTATDALDVGVSLLRQALDDLDENANQTARIRREAQENRENYDRAVNACCQALGDATGVATAAHPGDGHIGIPGILGGLMAFWRRGGERLAGDAGNVAGVVADVAWYVDHEVPVSQLGRWATPIERTANNGVFRMAGKGFLVLGVASDLQGLWGTFEQTRGESGRGRVFTTGATAGVDAVFLMPGPIGVVARGANLMDGGAFQASLNGIALIGGGFLSHGPSGALAGDDQFSDNAASGQYGGVVEGIAKGEDYLIEHPGAAAHAVEHAPVAAAKDVYHGAADLLGDL